MLRLAGTVGFRRRDSEEANDLMDIEEIERLFDEVLLLDRSFEEPGTYGGRRDDTE